MNSDHFNAATVALSELLAAVPEIINVEVPDRSVASQRTARRNDREPSPSGRPVDDGQRRQELGAGDRREPRRSSWSGATRGRPRRSAATSASCAASNPLGVAATNDIDALLALKPDCVVYNPMWLDVDELVRILSAGVNVVATAAFITGHNLGAGRDRIVDACQRGASTMFGTGISPGFAELLAIVSATICDRVDKVTVNEAADTTFYDSPATEMPVGFGKPIDHPELQAMTAQGTAVFGEAVRLVADALGIELDDVRCEAEYAQTTADLDLGSWTIAGRMRRGCRGAAGRDRSATRSSSNSTSGGARARRSNPTGRSTRTAG